MGVKKKNERSTESVVNEGWEDDVVFKRSDNKRTKKGNRRDAQARIEASDCDFWI